ncbi:4-alpha-L-fucosyltransferase (Fuc4NAc transferase) [Fervidobacterium pennivorans DSM 9078]|uniref:4-alpha-L-fucosyltransferase (Fuc4NAc transferase) n=1 Tax=Fervidobacterium pennivorans (strain DSM 9078 / Ven5) TaxID=771875 RepID=H9UCG3_FERPD|nr:TDP-N-acetylfucosamine:lipid II N-acetylfucosaminyltransferase [Fervidobacterium pennivorans]AFG35206.1 4-alpha-L-fucosyltransferase (Fuc4NAc transferase) [Fervidobacterium pennivorans DSM 9078]
MVVHLLLAGYKSAYTKKFLEFLAENFPKNEHVVVAFGRNCSQRINKTNTDIKVLCVDSLRKLPTYFRLVKQARLIIAHSLFFTRGLMLLFTKPSVLRKTIWILWGGDLYNYWVKEHHNPKEKIIEFVKSVVIKKIKGVGCLVKEDYEFLKTKYATSARYFYVFYPNPVDFSLLDSVRNMASLSSSSKKKCLIGNSATETNKHLEILQALSKLKEEDFEIICPLSYGDKRYAEKIIEMGQRIFGTRFVPLTQFLSPDEYAKILASVDAAIFNHNRQQGLGNILALLYLGKKVYTRSDIPTWGFFQRLGITVYDTKEFLQKPDNSIFDFDERIGRRNSEIIAREFSEERCVEVWRNLFSN